MHQLMFQFAVLDLYREATEMSMIDNKAKFLDLIGNLEKCIKLIGVNFFNPNYVPGLLTLLTFIVSLSNILFTFYSLGIGWPNVYNMLKTLTTFGIGLQVFCY
jgi:hypothetical protein